MRSGREKPRILIIDDDPVVRNLLVLLLNGVGHEVECVGDGESGWTAICANNPDLVITDHAMPRLTGLNLLRRMRAYRLTFPAILMSGSIPWNESDLASLLNPGAILEKPFGVAALLATVSRLLPPSSTADRDSCARTSLAGVAR